MINRRQFLITTGAALAAAGIIVPTLNAKLRPRRQGEIVLFDQDGDPFYFVQLPNHGGYRCGLDAKDKWPKFPLIADSQDDIEQFARYGIIIEQPNVRGWGFRKTVFERNHAFLKNAPADMEIRP